MIRHYLHVDPNELDETTFGLRAAEVKWLVEQHIYPINGIKMKQR